MKRFVFRLVLALAAAQPLCAAEPGMDGMPEIKATWYYRWFGIGSAPPKPAPPVRREPAAEAAAQRAKAEADLQRRLKVCDEMRRIAVDTGNDQLYERAFILEQKAAELYKQQTAHLPCSRLVPSEEKLDRQLGTTATAAAAEEKLTPAKPENSRTSQANAFREVKP